MSRPRHCVQLLPRAASDKKRRWRRSGRMIAFTLPERIIMPTVMNAPYLDAMIGFDVGRFGRIQTCHLGRKGRRYDNKSTLTCSLVPLRRLSLHYGIGSTKFSHPAGRVDQSTCGRAGRTEEIQSSSNKVHLRRRASSSPPWTKRRIFPTSIL